MSEGLIQRCAKKQIRVSRFGGPEVLELVDAPVPVPGPGQAVVRVAYANVNPTDAGARTGHSPRGPLELPLTPGWDLAGTVSAVGDGVEDLQVGYLHASPHASQHVSIL